MPEITVATVSTLLLTIGRRSSASPFAASIASKRRVMSTLPTFVGAAGAAIGASVTAREPFLSAAPAMEAVPVARTSARAVR